MRKLSPWKSYQRLDKLKSFNPHVTFCLYYRCQNRYDYSYSEKSIIWAIFMLLVGFGLNLCDKIESMSSKKTWIKWGILWMRHLHTGQGFSFLVYWHFGLDTPLSGGLLHILGCLAAWSLPPRASSTSSPGVTANVSRHCQM